MAPGLTRPCSCPTSMASVTHSDTLPPSVNPYDGDVSPGAGLEERTMNQRVWKWAIAGISLAACAEVPEDFGPQPGPEWDHCPSSESYVGDDGWKRSLFVTNEAVFCEYPYQHQSIERTLEMDRKLRVVAGNYPVPSSGSGLDFHLPVCVLDSDGPLAGATPGTVQASENTQQEGLNWWVQMEQPRAEGEGVVSARLAADSSEDRVHVAGEPAFTEGLALQLCETAECAYETSSQFAPCAFEPTTCDRFSLEDGDALILDQYLWVGQVGAGFSAITEARGRYRGTEFSVSNRDQLKMSFGHHAFTRTAMVFFDAPIGDACGLYVDEVTSSWYSDGVWTVDCEGNRLEPLEVVDESHPHQQGPCEG